MSRYADREAVEGHLKDQAEARSLYAARSEAEVVGAALSVPRDVEDVFDKLTATMFGDSILGKVWASAVERARTGRAISPDLIAEDVGPDPDFLQRGGALWLEELVRKASVFGIYEHAEIIADRAGRRAIDRTLKDVGAALDKGEAASPLLDLLDREVTRLRDADAPAQDNLVDAWTSANATIAEMEEEARVGRPKGAMTGLRCFDRRLRGLRPGWLIVLAGRPSMGKSALARAAALGCARKNREATTLFFALEMQRRELDERTLSQISYEQEGGVRAIAYRDMGGDTMPTEDLFLLRRCAEHVPNNFLIDDTPTLSVDYVRRRVLSMSRKRRVASVWIDYLQIMKRPDSKGRNDAAVIGDMTASLKRLAREAQTCIVLLSQLSRGVESRDDKRPQLSDLRDSGAIEQDANAVLFPYREAYYTERAEPKADAPEGVKLAWRDRLETERTQLDVICAKARQAAIGTDKQTYRVPYDVVEDRE